MLSARVPIKSLAFGLFVVAYLSIQVYLPTRCVVDGTYCTVGWVMMATRLDTPTFFVRHGSGEEASLTELDPDRTRSHVERAKIEGRFIVRHLCEQFPDATAIRVLYSLSRREEITPCN